MVIRIIVEGGAYPNPPHSATDLTLDGSEVLREELKKFFTTVLGIADISIIVSYQAGYKNAAKVFISKPEENYLYTDLDYIPEKRADWFAHLEEDGVSYLNEAVQMAENAEENGLAKGELYLLQEDYVQHPDKSKDCDEHTAYDQAVTPLLWL